MSDTVHYKGKMRRIPREEGQTDREYTDKVLNEFNSKFDQEAWDDYYEDDGLSTVFSEILDYRSFAFVNGEVYKVTEFKDSEDTDVFNVQDLGDGLYSFELVYYNGACGFDEAMEHGFEKLNK